MAPKPKFTKEQIIDAAFHIARMEGIDQITIRKVADQLGCSIAPIYVNFNDANELVEAVVQKAYAISRQLFLDNQTGDPFHDIGVASLRFAKEYSMLFRDLAFRKNADLSSEEAEMTFVIQQMQADPILAGFSVDELKTILFKLKIFQTGLSLMVANGGLPAALNDDDVISLLDDCAVDVMVSAQLRKEGRLESIIAAKDGSPR